MPPSTGVLGYFRRRHDALTSLVLTIPVFLAYHLGIVLIDRRNGVDLVTTLTLQLLSSSVWAYVGVTLGYAAALVLAALAMKRGHTVRPRALWPVLAESTLWSVAMAVSVGWAVRQLVDAQTGPPPLGVLDRMVMAAGAGFHEELVFRAGLFGGGAWLLQRGGLLRRAPAFVWAALASAIVFAAMHHLGPYGDTFTWVRGAFRVLAGLFLTLIYALRGFAVAVYTHTIYDLWVFFALE